MSAKKLPFPKSMRGGYLLKFHLPGKILFFFKFPGQREFFLREGDRLHCILKVSSKEILTAFLN